MVASLVFVDAVASSSSSDFNISTSKGNRGCRRWKKSFDAVLTRTRRTLLKKKKKNRIYFCTMPTTVHDSFVPLYPTYRSCFKEFRPPIFLRNRYP